MTSGATRWLLLVHHLPAEPSNLRVKIWRRLQAVGAVALKNSVYVLPHTSETREDFEWIRGEIVDLGGEASLFAADAVDGLTTEEVVAAFREARRSDWAKLGERIAALEAAGGEARDLQVLRNRAARLDRIDFFGADGRDEVLRGLERAGGNADAALTGGVRRRPPAAPAVSEYRGRTWVTRPHPGVDRMASAWLIRRFIDPEAVFDCVERVPSGAVPFDMFGVEFGHHGDRCTFETLAASFGLDEPAVGRIGRIVHDLDLRGEVDTDSETATIGRLVGGFRQSSANDEELLERGMGLFEALYRSFESESAAST